MCGAPTRLWAQKTAGDNWDEPIATRCRVEHFHEYVLLDTHEAVEAKNERLEKRLNELKAENAKLREKNKALSTSINQVMVVNAALHQMFEIKYEEATAFLTDNANPFTVEGDQS